MQEEEEEATTKAKPGSGYRRAEAAIHWDVEGVVLAAAVARNAEGHRDGSV
jgi:hypothetical protein